MNKLKELLLEARRNGVHTFPLVPSLKVNVRRPINIDELPRREASEHCFKLSSLARLVWDYAISATDTAEAMDRENLDKCDSDVCRLRRKMCQQIRKLYEDRHTGRVKYISQRLKAEEARFMDVFEESVDEHLSTLNRVLMEDALKQNLSREMRYLVMAAGAAYTLVQALELYDEYAIKWCRSLGCYLPTLLTKHYQPLKVLLRSLCGDAWTDKSPNRDLSAKIIFNQLKAVEFEYNDN